jgi:hypothetical protein
MCKPFHKRIIISAVQKEACFIGMKQGQESSSLENSQVRPEGERSWTILSQIMSGLLREDFSQLKFLCVRSDDISMKCILNVTKCLFQKVSGGIRQKADECDDDFIGYEAFCEQCLPDNVPLQYKQILLSEKTFPWVKKG